MRIESNRNTGDLVTAYPETTAGALHRVVIRDFRRDLMEDVVAEGYDYFTAASPVVRSQAFPDTEEDIEVIADVIRADGEREILVLTKTEIFRFNVGELRWDSILSGVTPGNRWEFVACGDIVVMNNGVELPYGYRVGDAHPERLYQMRDAGISKVGTIGSSNDILLVGDITIITGEDSFDTVRNSADYYEPIALEDYHERFSTRIAWSNASEPRQFKATVPASMTAGSKTITFRYKTKSFAAGDEILIVGAGPGQSNLIVTLDSYSSASGVGLVSEAASTTVVNALVSLSLDSGGISAYDELDDDAGAVLRIATLGSAVVFYKTTGIYVGQYTADSISPWNIERFYIWSTESGNKTNMGLAYKYALFNVGEMYHVYAGESDFYMFDLSARVPRIFDKLSAVRNLFYDNVTLEDIDDVFCAENSLTWQHNIFLPRSSTGDYVIQYNYREDKVSTSSMQMSAAGLVADPITGHNIFALAKNNVVLLYGKSVTPRTEWDGGTAIYYRRSAKPESNFKTYYTPEMASGFIGDPEEAVALERYTVELARKSADVPLQVQWYTAESLSAPLVLRGTKLFTSPKTKGTATAHIRGCFIQEKITVPTPGNLRIVARQMRLLKERQGRFTDVA